MAGSIDINDFASPAVKAMMESLQGPNVNPVVGRAGASRVQQHLFALNSSRPNKLGGKRTNFWAQCARSTNFTVLADGAVVAINQVGMRQRLEGGTITARNAKWLTIPAVAEAHGKRAGEFNNLRFAVLGGHPALIEAEHSGVSFSKKGKVRATLNLGGQVVYWLKRSVYQKPDPSVLPSNEELGVAVIRALDSYLAHAAKRGGQHG